MMEESDQEMRQTEESELPLQKNEVNIDSNGTENDYHINKDESNGDDAAFLETIIDQKGEDELLKLENEQTNRSVEKDLEELFNNVQSEMIDSEKPQVENKDMEVISEADDGDFKQVENKDIEVKPDDDDGDFKQVENKDIEVKPDDDDGDFKQVEKNKEVNPEADDGDFKQVEKNTEVNPEADDGDFKQDENGLLDECEPPKEIELTLDDEQSNEVPDEDSNQNGISDQDAENNELDKEDVQIGDNSSLRTDTDSLDKNQIESEVITPSTELNELKNNGISDQESVVTIIADVEKNEPLNIPSESNDVEMTDANDQIEIKNQVEEEKCDIKTEEKYDIKTEEKYKSESTIPFERVKFSFMRKFAKECGKLSRADLEELLLEKVTEAIVYKSQCTEMRTKFDKQEETIERLQNRLAVVTKQYNDLEMIHKRVEKDLKERPEGPIQPVRITRAVGLQVFLEKSNSSAGTPTPTNNKNKSISNNTSSSLTSSNKSMAPIAKRQMDIESTAVRTAPNENEPKRKKCKIITPLRPVLSEKEETSLKMQEALHEKNIRMKVATKVANPVHVAQKISSPNLLVTSIQNGIQKQTSIPSTSIDLTDDLDDVPSSRGQVVTHPPALIAIQRGMNGNTVTQINRTVNRPGATIVRGPNIHHRSHPAPLPSSPAQVVMPNTKKVPPRPNIKINNVQNGIIVSWTVDGLSPAEHAEIQCYQIYAYEESNSPPSTENWKHVGDVKALLLPMAVTLTQFQEGQRYFFAVRAMDVYKRLGQFSLPKTWA